MESLIPIRHHPLKTTTTSLNNISPRILTIQSNFPLPIPYTTSWCNRFAYLPPTRLHHPLTQCLRIRIRDRDMKNSASRIVKCCWNAHWGIDELEELKADAVASGKEGELHFVEFGVVDAEDGGVGGDAAVTADGGAQRREAEDSGVPGYSGFKVGDVEGDVVYYPVVGIGFECHFGIVRGMGDCL
jgi:hypothetical protein